MSVLEICGEKEVAAENQPIEADPDMANVQRKILFAQPNQTKPNQTKPNQTKNTREK
jgi:hypothetical protein